jgi:hypothetical protein
MTCGSCLEPPRACHPAKRTPPTTAPNGPRQLKACCAAAADGDSSKQTPQGPRYTCAVINGVLRRGCQYVRGCGVRTSSVLWCAGHTPHLRVLFPPERFLSTTLFVVARQSLNGSHSPPGTYLSSNFFVAAACGVAPARHNPFSSPICWQKVVCCELSE